MKDYAKAFAPLDHALELEPNNWAARMNRAIANLQSDRLDAAQADYEEVRKLTPNLHSVYFGLGEIAWRRKQTAEAITQYEQYLKFAPAGLEEAKSVASRLQELKAGPAPR